jgi:hypothetical protein
MYSISGDGILRALDQTTERLLRIAHGPVGASLVGDVDAAPHLAHERAAPVEPRCAVIVYPPEGAVAATHAVLDRKRPPLAMSVEERAFGSRAIVLVDSVQPAVLERSVGCDASEAAPPRVEHDAPAARIADPEHHWRLLGEGAQRGVGRQGLIRLGNAHRPVLDHDFA